jgi:hypothetical protein
LNHTVTFAGASRLEIGGSGANDSIEGMLYYVAVYAKALSAAEVGQNAALLMVSDDAP